MKDDWTTATISSPIDADLFVQLKAIEPSRDGEMEYYPCQVTLSDGQMIDHVYVVPDQPYYHDWGIWPKDDKGKQEIDIRNVVLISESPSRLPIDIANELYRAGESGMGYCVFTLEFKDGTRQAYVTGNAVDFIPMPKGQDLGDIVRVMPHQGRGDENQLHGYKYLWCLFNGVKA